VRRDLALAVAEGIPAGRVEALAAKAGAPLLESIVPFDVFRGPQLPSGTRSLAFRLQFRAPDRTLTDGEIDAAVARIVEALASELGAGLRA
jgi:phenylalanyl-tRNA synthetase beta chain